MDSRLALRTPQPAALAVACRGVSPSDLASFGLQSSILEWDDAPLHYFDIGTGPTLLFVHGAPGWAFTWRGVMARLKQRFRCIAVDLPGFGLSPARSADVSLWSLSAAVEHLVKSLALRDFTLVANDTGGSVGFGAAGRSADRVRALVAISTFAYRLDDFPQVRFFLRLFSSAPARALNRWLNLIPRSVVAFGTRRRWEARERAMYLAPFGEREVRERCGQTLRALIAQADYLAEVEANLSRLSERPFLALFGEQDKAIQFGFPKRFNQLFSNYTFTTVPNALHFPQEDDAERVAAEIERWYDARVAKNPS